MVTTGNDFEHINNKLKLLNSSYSFDVWADGGIIKYENEKPCNNYKNYEVDKINDTLEVIKLYSNYNKIKDKILLRGDWPNRIKATCISIKPLKDNEKFKLVDFLNNEFKLYKINNKAIINGNTTIDIIKNNLNKSKIFKFDYYKNISKKEMIYIGDEIYSLLDRDLTKQVKYKYNVNSLYETNLILKLLNNKIY